MKNNIKIYIPLIIFTLICHDSYSQSSFDILISTSLYEKVHFAEEDLNGNFYLVGYKTELFSSRDCAWLLKIDHYGNILKEVLICIQDTTTHANIIEIWNDTLYIFGNKGPLSTGKRDILWILKADFDLNIIKNKSLHTSEEFHYQGPTSLIMRENHFIALGNTVPDTNSQLPDICFYELNQNLDSVKYSIDFRPFIQVGVDMIFDNFEKVYKVFGHGTYPNTYAGYDELIKFDTNFNFIGVDSIAWQIRSQLSATVYDDSTYMVSGNKHIYSPSDENIGIIRLDHNDHLQYSQEFGKDYDTTDYPGINNNVDFVDKNNIYCGGTSNFIVSQWPWQTDNSWIILVNLDSNLNFNWQRFYGGDAFYHLWGLLATQDGGCLMYAVRYDENTQFEEYDVYILKVDSNGLLTSTRKYPSISINEIIIYPNPASENITVRYPDIFNYKKREVVIYNALGNEIRKVVRAPGQPEDLIDVSDFPPGIYIAVLKANGEKIAVGKFVVE